jgi:ubiquinone/menaquinone biosynthesis C-methylase UbiE
MTSPTYGSPDAWSAGPDLVYGALATAAVALLPLPPPPTGALTLDAGAGTGAIARALRMVGAAVVEVDSSESMLRHDAATRPQRIVADLTRLPLRKRCFHAAVAGFVLSHLVDPELGLSELARVTRPDGAVMATAFPAGPRVPSYPVKVAVDDVLTRYGYQSPDWYAALKSAGEARVGDQSALARLGLAAGLHDVRVDQVSVDIAHLGDHVLVRWRLGMAQVAPWLQAQDPGRRAEITLAARHALEAIPPAPLPMLVLRGRPAPL